MLNQKEILSTIEMIDQQHLDIRTITMGISLLDCADADTDRSCEKIYDKITSSAERLVAVGEEIERRRIACPTRLRWIALQKQWASTSSAAFRPSCKRA